jgi:hypothetical protein
MGASVRIESRAALRALGDLAAGARALGGARMEIGSRLPYAYGIETGFTRSGRVARRAGGAWMLRDAKEAVRSQIEPVLAAALPHGPSAVDAAFRRLGAFAVQAARARTPVVTGRLRASIDILAGGIGSAASGLRGAFGGRVG